MFKELRNVSISLILLWLTMLVMTGFNINSEWIYWFSIIVLSTLVRYLLVSIEAKEWELIKTKRSVERYRHYIYNVRNKRAEEANEDLDSKD